MDQEEDIALIRALRTNRKVALKELHGRYSDVLYRFAYTIVKDRVIAEDILQETFLRFYNSSASFMEINGVRAYLFRTVKNFAFRHLRDEKIRRRAIQRADRSTLPEDVDARYIDAEMIRLIYLEVQSMPDDYKQVIELILDENLDNESLAQRLGIKPGAVRVRKYRAIEWIRVAFRKKNH